MIINIIIAVVVAVLGLLLGIYIGNSKFIGSLKNKKDLLEKDLEYAEKEAKDIKEKAIEEAKSIKKKEIVEAREEIHKMRKEFDKEIKQQKDETKALEDRLIRREENLDRKEENLDKTKEKIENEKIEIEKMKKDAQDKLNEVANLTEEEARQIIMNEVKEKYEVEIAQKFKEIKENYEEDAKKYSKWVITTAIQRYASDVTSEITTSTVVLPADDMKGRIIGREGRNISYFEKIAGVEVVIDDTPQAVRIS